MTVTPLLTRLTPPSSVSVKAPDVRLLVLIGVLKEMSMDETDVLRGLGETAAIEVIDSDCKLVKVKPNGTAPVIAVAVTV